MWLILFTFIICISRTKGDADAVPYGSSCTNDTQCRKFGTWPGGEGNCHEGICECLIAQPCQSDRQCCSGKCVSNKCAPGPVGSICNSYTQDANRTECVCIANSCDKGLVCENPQADVLLYWPYANHYGICGVSGAEAPENVTEQNSTEFGKNVPYREVCVKDLSNCEPIGHWPGGLGNCLNGLCDCRLHGVCQKDSECCSNKCLGKRCQPGNGTDVCHEGTCVDGLECLIPSGGNNIFNKLADKAGTCGVAALFYDKCANSTHCKSVGGWEGGVNNCKDDRCDCVAQSPCTENNECCSGICLNGECEKGESGDVCDIPTCKPQTNCVVVSTNESINGTIPKCVHCKNFSSNCENDTVCCQEHGWVGGISVCTNGLCECKVATNCSSDRECCSNICTPDGICARGNDGQLCLNGTDSTCVRGLYCDGSRGPKPEFGICTPKSPFKWPCDKTTFCKNKGRWPGGLGNCNNQTCDCSHHPESCQIDAECCSNKCVNNTCAPGSNGTYCEKDTCDQEYDCLKITTADSNNTIHSSCQECVPMRSACTNETFCCNGRKSAANISWPGGVGNCFNNICECRTISSQCEDNFQCCTNICEEGVCRNSNDSESTCTRGTEDCGNNLGCTGNSSVSTELKGTCEDCSTFGSNCSDTENITYCCPASKWPGAYNNCFQGTCKCRVFENCTESRQCCSGNCSSAGQCEKGTDGDLCLEESCKNEHMCIIPSPDTTMATLLNDTYGTCVACQSYNSDCNATTTCCKADEWVGGYGNCYKDKCACIVDNEEETCKHDRECCNNRCFNGHCQAGEKTEWCNTTSCSHKLGCTAKNEFDATLGKCQECTKLGSTCDNDTFCCPVTTWHAGKSVCLNGKCSCRLQENCTCNRECCSGSCKDGTCEPGNETSICDPNHNETCREGLKCPTPSQNPVVAEVYKNERGTCVDDQCGWAKIKFLTRNIPAAAVKFRFKQPKVEEEGWPWMAHISFGNRTIAGVLLNAHFVLTSAAIAAPDAVADLSKIKVEIAPLRTGTTDNAVTGVKQIIPHPSAFRSGKVTDHFDLALLRLTSPVLHSDAIDYPCLAQRQQRVEAAHCAVAGWMPQPQKNRDRVVYEPVLFAKDTCNATDESQFCAVSYPENVQRLTCGNTGGPLICRIDIGKEHEQWDLQGIASFNLDCNKNYSSFGFQSISYHQDWIVGEINKPEE